MDPQLRVDRELVIEELVAAWDHYLRALNDGSDSTTELHAVRRHMTRLRDCAPSEVVQTPDQLRAEIGRWLTGESFDEVSLSNRLSFITISPKINAANPPSPARKPTRLDAMVDFWTPPIGFTGVALFENANLSALKTAFIGLRPSKDNIIVDYNPNGANQPHSEFYETMMFLPFVDGTYHARFVETNDFRVMERGLCLALHGLNFNDEGGACGRKNLNNY